MSEPSFSGFFFSSSCFSSHSCSSSLALSLAPHLSSVLLTGFWFLMTSLTVVCRSFNSWNLLTSESWTAYRDASKPRDYYLSSYSLASLISDATMSTWPSKEILNSVILSPLKFPRLILSQLVLKTISLNYLLSYFNLDASLIFFFKSMIIS